MIEYCSIDQIIRGDTLKHSIQTNLFAVGVATFVIICNLWAMATLLLPNSSTEISTDLMTTPIESLSQPSTEVAEVTIEENVHHTFDDVMKEQKNNPQKAIQMAQLILKDDYNNNLQKAQPDILKSLQSHHLATDEMAYLFLDKHPSKHVDSSAQLDVPLKLQTDPHWRHLEYGSDSSRQLWENGCAIVTLSMVKEYLDQKEVTPANILNWSQQSFYRHNEGTSWQIFPAFANEFNYHYTDLGNDFYGAMEEIQQGNIVIVSVKPGYFTEIGHILVIRGYENGQVFVNDPNDSVDKLHSYQGVPEEIFLNEGINYWSFSN